MAKLACVLGAGSLVLSITACGVDEQTVTLGVPTSVDTSDSRTGHKTVNPIIPEARGALEREYRDALERERDDKVVEVNAVAVPIDERVDQLREGRITVTYGCVGELLDALDAKKGQELRQMYAEEEKADRAQWRDITHSTMLSALPSDLAASDPGMAVACEDDSLPQNIVALWKKPSLDRDDRKALTDVAGGVSTEDLLFGVDGSEGG